MGRFLYIDFEFNRIVEPKVNLVCAATYDPKTKQKAVFWLHRSKDGKRKLREYLKKYDIIVGYSCVAEARSFLALDLDPLQFQWLDLFLEYRMMTNHNDELNWGEQLVDGKVRVVRKPKPKWERTEQDKATGFKPTHSLAEATFKLTGAKRDTVEKDRMRDLIISDPKEFSPQEKKDILRYCLDDVVFLPTIWKGLKDAYASKMKRDKDADFDDLMECALVRGRYSAHTAIMETLGYPIDVEKTKNFSTKVGSIMFELQREINSLFPDIKPFKWNRPENRMSENQAALKAYITKNHDPKKWQKTDSGGISLALDAWEKYYPFKHDYPKNNFGAQMVRYYKMKQSVYGFSQSDPNKKTFKKKNKTFWDAVGSDGRARPYMNHFGAQSSRSQPAATGFMFLKPAWMRALVVPARGTFMASIDYGQQEFFLSALESRDKNMIEAYLSGDPYLYGAKLAGAIPKDGTKDSHPVERNLFKNTYLGIMYGMTQYGLAIKLTNDMGRTVTEAEAQLQIDIFERTFPKYMAWKEKLGDRYDVGYPVILPCGWIMWCDNENKRSVYNVPIQGFGASIMRKAVDIAVENGCKIVFTLHDAIYIEHKIGEEKYIKVLADAMVEAFQFYFKGTKRFDVSGKIKLDPFAWSPNYKPNSEINIDGFKVPTTDLYVDERSIVDYKKFSKYFDTPLTDLL